eukprot:comp6310_c0_seq1/m.2116 comp6310_c0_seq1/g.2116  ORF comp6310_c0_seq1/g.2116 comp6310_c0_seq1/m.2116 type:complete len:320 (+) comp6310_c0_seq1:678-1637(+)
MADPKREFAYGTHHGMACLDGSVLFGLEVGLNVGIRPKLLPCCLLQSIVELPGDVSNALQRLANCKHMSQIGIEGQCMVVDLEHVRTNHRQLGLVRAAQLEVFICQLPHGKVFARKEGRVVQIGLGRHHTVHTCVVHAPLDVLKVQQVAVAEYGYAHGLLNGFDGIPVRQPRVVALHFPCAAMHGQHLGPGPFQHLCILDRLVDVRVDPDLARDRHLALVVQLADHGRYQVPLLHQERPVVAPLCDLLGATQVQVDGITAILDHLGGLQQCVWVVCAKLNYQRSVLGACRKVVFAVLLVTSKYTCIQHGCIDQIRIVSA